MSRSGATSPDGRLRALLIGAVLLAILIPVIGLMLLSGDDTELVSSTGDVTLAPGNRMIYVTDGHVASLSLAADGTSAGEPVIADLLCGRIHAAAGTGLCLRRTNAVAWSATVVDQNLAATATFPLTGTPALARVSPSGNLVAWTTLTSGTALGGNSTTATAVVDRRGDSQVIDLSTFTARLKGKPLTDFQVWGVSFLDDESFFATVVVGDERHLALGSMSTRTLKAFDIDGANPEVSPDGKRIAFIHDAGRAGRGHLAVMEIESRQVTDLGDQRGISDQPAWLSDDLIAYVVVSDDGTPSIWTTSADPAGRPLLLRDRADSPSSL